SVYGVRSTAESSCTQASRPTRSVTSGSTSRRQAPAAMARNGTGGGAARTAGRGGLSGGVAVPWGTTAKAVHGGMGLRLVSGGEEHRTPVSSGKTGGITASDGEAKYGDFASNNYRTCFFAWAGPFRGPFAGPSGSTYSWAVVLPRDPTATDPPCSQP